MVTINFLFIILQPTTLNINTKYSVKSRWFTSI